MTWLWSSQEEFNKYVVPVYLDKPGNVHGTRIYPSFENLKSMFNALEKFKETIDALGKMGYADDSPAQNKKELHEARRLMWTLVLNGEIILLHHKRLALSSWASDFIYEKDLEEHWEHYSSGIRIYNELNKLIIGAKKMLEGFFELSNQDEDFLVYGLSLPDHLKEDFLLARNLFSVGFDSVGAFVAGRGLEGVLREVAKIKGIYILDKNKNKNPANEATFHDLIQTFYSARWRKDKRRLIDDHTRILLDQLRTLRNYGAHPRGQNEIEYLKWREFAIIISNTANSIWLMAQKRYARLVTKEIEKNW